LNPNPYEEISAGIANGDLLEKGVITTSDKEESIIFETITSEKIDYKITEKRLFQVLCKLKKLI